MNRRQYTPENDALHAETLRLWLRLPEGVAWREGVFNIVKNWVVVDFYLGRLEKRLGL